MNSILCAYLPPALRREDPLEEDMATHSSILAWRIPGMGEPGRLPSLGSHRVGHNWSNLAMTILMIQWMTHSHWRWPMAAKETQIERTDFWTLWEKGRVGWFERISMKHVYYRMCNRSPAQVQCMRQDAQGWCIGMTLRDGMGREVQNGEHMHTHGGFMSMYGKANTIL